MTEWITQIEGNRIGHQAALLVGSWPRRLLHGGVWRIAKKRRHDRADPPAPDRLFLLPDGGGFSPLFVRAMARAPHVGHFLPAHGNSHCLQLVAGLGLYQRAYTVVYPVVRGTGPLFHGHWCLSDFTKRAFYRRVYSGWGLLLVRGSLGCALQLCVNLVSERDTLNRALGCCSNRAVCPRCTRLYALRHPARQGIV